MPKPHDEVLRSELLLKGLITLEQESRILGEMNKRKTSFKETVVVLGFLKEEDLALAEASILDLPFLSLDDYLINPDVVSLVPEKTARQHHIIPVFKVGKTLTVATSDPLNVLALDEVRAASGGDVETVVSTREMIRKALDQCYGVGGSLKEVIQSFESQPSTKLKGRTDAASPQTSEESAPVIRLVNMMIMQALDEGASDIHIEPESDGVRIRNRVDGVLHLSSEFPKKIQMDIAARIKIMAKLDIAETRKPQDGKIRLKLGDRDLDIRVSTFPTNYGENIVMRLLEQSKVLIGLADLGMEPAILRAMESLIHKPYGMVLVTGPTGSGKTTTLYSALNAINTVDKNIITIEDPIEYQIPMIRQTQVNPKAGLTFATGLRSILRQDPDVILVGEIRDAETADIAIQAALTGHLVFSTIHTNDAPGAVARLVDMQIEPFLIASALVGVMGQRLVRTVCERCKQPYSVGKEMADSLSIKDLSGSFYRGKGCAACHETGYSGRLGIFEVLNIDDGIRQLILKKAGAG